MERDYFLETERIGFSSWMPNDIELAKSLWGDSEVTRFICASGKFSEAEIINRLERELYNGREHQIQYWPIFENALL